MKLLIVDTETTSIDFEDSNFKCLEVCAILWDAKTSIKEFILSSVVYHEQPFLNPNQLINGIEPCANLNAKTQWKNFQLIFPSLVEEADYLVAHNSEFDQKSLATTGIEVNKKWLCTFKDFQLFPIGYQGKKDLISLAQFHGVGVSCSHTAVYDCLLLAEVFSRINDFEEALTSALSPQLEAYVKKDDDSPRQYGFYWDRSKKGWFGKSVNPSQLPFPTAIEATRVEASALVSYDEREKAKAWGFEWDSTNKKWHRLINHVRINYFDFPVKISSQN